MARGSKVENMEGLKGKRVLVTGGAGFIGSHLALELTKKDLQVFVIDIKVNPKSFFSLNKLSNKLTFNLLDIRDKIKVLKYFSKFKFDYVYHLAAESLVEQGYENPDITFETNIMGTVNILEAVRKNKKIKGVFVASSDKAYGKTKKPYTENHRLAGDHPYDVSKSAADLICNAYYKTYGLPVVVTRFGNVYGQGDLQLNRIVPGICEAIAKDKVLKIRSNGNYVRDYVYVKDVVDGYLLLLKKIYKIKGEAFNFSSKDNFSVIELIKKAEKLSGKKINYKILNKAKNEIPYQHLVDTKVRKLGWKNKYSIESVFLEVLEWYKNTLN